MEREIITITEASKILKISRSSAYNYFPQWRARGMEVIKAGVNASPRFYKDELLKVCHAIANQSQYQEKGKKK